MLTTALLAVMGADITLLCGLQPFVPQVENNSLAEGLTRQKAEVTVLTQKRARVEQALEAQVKESKALKVAAQRLQVSDGSLALPPAPTS